MPDRIIRDELFRSARFIRLTSDTLRLLFIGFLLEADDLANAEATTEAIEDILHRDVPDETAARWCSELADAGLVRTYPDPENPEKRLIHIPKFRQRLRYIKGKHPTPPPEIECKEIKLLREKVGPKTDLRQSVDRPQSAEVKGSEVKGSKTGLQGLVTPTPSRASNPEPATLNPILKVGPTIQALTLTPTRKTNDDLERERKRQLDEIAKRVKP